jgi:hypothetical protein
MADRLPPTGAPPGSAFAPGARRVPGGPRFPGPGFNARALAVPGAPAQDRSPQELAPNAPPTSPSADPVYGSRARSFQDPFPAWDPRIVDVCVAGEKLAVAANARVELVRYVPQRGNVAWITGLGQEAICDAFGEVTWQIMRGGFVVLTVPPIAQVGSFLHRFPLHIPVIGGDVISVSAVNGANVRDLAAVLYGIEKPQDAVSPERA